MRNKLFTEIQDLKKSMKKHEEPLEVALTIARLYVTLGLQKLSIPFFKMASKITPYHPPRVHPQDQEIENRKLERMGKEQKAKYLEEKRLESDMRKAAHAERQRVRVMSAHYEIFLAHLEIKQAEEATRHMRSWLGMSRADGERNERCYELDQILSKYHDLNDMGLGQWKDKKYSDVTMHMQSSLGSLRDLHMETLEELLVLEPRNPDILLKLSRLHGLVRNFERSQHLYEDYIDVTEGTNIANMKSYKHQDFYYDKLTRSPRFRNEFGRDADPWGKSQGVLGAAPSKISSYDVDSVYDRLADSTRRDFTEFRTGDMSKRGVAGEDSEVSGGKHIGSTTIIYTVPPGGWQDDDTPMRCSSGGMRAAQSSGKEDVQEDVKRVRHGVSHGYRAKTSLVQTKNMKNLRRTIVNANNSNIFVANGSKSLDREDDLLDFADASMKECEDNGGALKLPLPTSGKEKTKYTIAQPCSRKGGCLPPRLMDSHDFRPMPGVSILRTCSRPPASSLFLFALLFIPPLLTITNLHRTVITSLARSTTCLIPTL